MSYTQSYIISAAGYFEWVWPSVVSAGAHLVQSLAQKLGSLLGNKPNYGRGKECDCVVLLLAHLYNYRVRGEGCGRGGGQLCHVTFVIHIHRSFTVY